MMTEKDIRENEERIIELLKSIPREGINNVINFMEENDFFRIPSSLHRHHNCEGGLAQHCLGVYDRLVETGRNLPEESIKIVSLLHDLCKAGKIYKNKEGEWCEKNDEELDLPGHGERSVKLLQSLGLNLTNEEKDAIRWHMGGYNIPKEEIREYFANKKSDLRRLLYNADRFDASHYGKTDL